jgi:hypothetical protein
MRIELKELGSTSTATDAPENNAVCRRAAARVARFRMLRCASSLIFEATSRVAVGQMQSQCFAHVSSAKNLSRRTAK